MAAQDGEALEARVLEMGRGGMGRVEIAAGLGLAVEELMALERERPGFALAMRRADTFARAWWEALPRETMAAGARFNLAGWLGVMRWRWAQPSRGNRSAGRSGRP